MIEFYKDKSNHPMFGKTHNKEALALISKPGELNPIFLRVRKGPKGPKGPQGSKGPRVRKGPKGPRVQGSKGPRVRKGPLGSEGGAAH